MQGVGREYFQKGERIFLSFDLTHNGQEEFEIGSVIGEGGTAVCYEACRIRDGYPMPGTLKELYPIEGVGEISRSNYRMVRGERNRQLCAEGDIDAFRCRKAEYLDPYRQVWKIIEERNQKHLGNFVQTGEVYYGIGDDDSATAYIWSSENDGISLERYLEEIQENPGKNVESKLNNILKVVKTLTRHLIELHKLGYMHLDIKPSNVLLVYQEKDVINPENVVLCDIDSLYNIENEMDYQMAGSEGYRAPELGQGRRPDHRADIYSIGALLFRAVMINDKLKGEGRYSDDYYDDIDVLVKNSKLLTWSVLNSDDQLVESLTDILKKCLAFDPNERYDSSSALLEDLNQVVEKSSVTNEIREQAKQNALADAAVAIQKFLYEHPLYESLPDSKEIDGEDVEIRVLVVGTGMYGQKFMDLCLQAGQMRGYALKIRAISKRPDKDCANYLRYRPDMARFVNVYIVERGDESQEPKKGWTYGSVRFDSIHGTNGKTEFKSLEEDEALQWNRGLVADIITQAEEQGKGYQYIFVALGKDELNRQIAQCFFDMLPDLSRDSRCCPVGYVWEGANRPDDLSGDSSPSPVLINKSLSLGDIDSDLEQMAFNTDCVWNGESYENIDEKKREFCSDAYRYSSSLAYVLSLKYKLYSLGISLDGGREQAAKEFSDKILSRIGSDDEAKEDYDMLACMEHRRWILDLAAEGWKAPRDENGNLDLERCVANGMVRNPIERTHPCMVFSNPEPALMQGGYSADDRSKWEDSNIDQELDELDKMSLQLHQCFRRKADEVINENPEYIGNMEEIQHLVIDLGEDINRKYTQFRFCLQNILDGVESYAKKYGNYKKQFQESLNGLHDDVQLQVQALLGDVDKEFFPVIEANLYRDYKKNDVDLVRKIPYILTFSPVCGIAMAFEDGLYQNGRNEAIFSDVASVTALCPREIHYLYYLTRSKSLELLVDKVSAVLSYFGQRRMSCEVFLHIICMKDVDQQDRTRLSEELDFLEETQDRHSDTVHLNHTIIDCFDSLEAAQKFREYLENLSDILYDGSTLLFASAMENGAFVRDVCDKGIPYFEFDWRKKEFAMCERCDYLQYIEDNSYLRINDIFSLMKATDNRNRPPEFMDDYKDLWEIYTTNAGSHRFSNSVRTWNILCQYLGAYEDSRKPLAEKKINPETELVVDTIVYNMPQYTFQTVRHILNQLISLELVGAESSIVSHTSENYRLILVADKTWEEVFDQVFDYPQYLQDYYDVQVNIFGKNNKTVRFTYNSMEVNGINLNPDEKPNWNDSLYKLLKKLQEKRYIRNLRKDEEKDWIFSFAYSSPLIKDLLISAGRILEIYAYYEALKTGYFDDIATGYEFLWEESDVKNELDLILTKGFHSIFVECKAVRKLELGYYHKLHSLAEHFGIGTIKVMLGNTYMENRDEVADSTNKMERSRGKQMNIKTIYNKDHIENIGQTLKKLMEDQL